MAADHNSPEPPAKDHVVGGTLLHIIDLIGSFVFEVRWFIAYQ